MGIDTGYATTTQCSLYEHNPKLSTNDEAIVRQAVIDLDFYGTTEIKIKGLGLSKNKYELTRTAEGHIHVKRVKYNIFLRLFRLKPSMIHAGSESNSDHEVGYHFLGETSRLIYKVGNEQLQRQLSSNFRAHSVNYRGPVVEHLDQSTTAAVSAITADIVDTSSSLAHLPSKDIATQLWQTKSNSEILVELRFLSPSKAWDVFNCLCNKNEILQLTNSNRNREHYGFLIEHCLKGVLEFHSINDLLTTDTVNSSEYEKVLLSSNLWANKLLHPYLTALIIKLPNERIKGFLFRFEESDNENFSALVNSLVNFSNEKQQHCSSTLLKSAEYSHVNMPNENLNVSTTKCLSKDAKHAIQCIAKNCLVTYLLETRSEKEMESVGEFIMQFDGEFIADFLLQVSCVKCICLPSLVHFIALNSLQAAECDGYILNMYDEIDATNPHFKKWLNCTRTVPSWVYSTIIDKFKPDKNCKTLLSNTPKSYSDKRVHFEQECRVNNREYTVSQANQNRSPTSFVQRSVSQLSDEQHLKKSAMTSSQHDMSHGWQLRKSLSLSYPRTINSLSLTTERVKAQTVPTSRDEADIVEECIGETLDSSFDLPDLLPESITDLYHKALNQKDFAEFEFGLQAFEVNAEKEFEELKNSPIKIQLLKLCYKNLVAKYYELYIDSKIKIKPNSLDSNDVTEQELNYSCELVKLNAIWKLEQHPLELSMQLKTMELCSLQCKINETKEKREQAEAGLKNAEETNKALAVELMKESDKGQAKDQNRINRLQKEIDTKLLKKRCSELEQELFALSREPTKDDCAAIYDKAIKHCESQIKSKICGIMNSKLASEQHNTTPLSFTKLEKCLTTKHLDVNGEHVTTWLDIAELKKLHIISAKWYANYNSIDHLLGQEGLVEADIKDIVKRSWQHLPIYMPKEHLDNIVKLVEDTKEQKVRFTSGAFTNKNACSILLSERLFQTSFLNALASEYPETLTYILTQLPTEIMDAEDYHACFLACNTLLATHSKLLKSGCWGQLEKNWQAEMMTCADDVSDQDPQYFNSLIKTLSHHTKGTEDLDLSVLNINWINSIAYSAFDIKQPCMNILACLNFATSYLGAYLATKVFNTPGELLDEDELLRTVERKKIINAMQVQFCDIGTEICRLFLPTWDGGKSTQPVLFYYDIESNRFAVSSDVFQPRNDFALWKKVVQPDKS